jgi:hypothetical protein
VNGAMVFLIAVPIAVSLCLPIFVPVSIRQEFSIMLMKPAVRVFLVDWVDFLKYFVF